MLLSANKQPIVRFNVATLKGVCSNANTISHAVYDIEYLDDILKSANTFR
jgi:hypothetical protein